MLDLSSRVLKKVQAEQSLRVHKSALLFWQQTAVLSVVLNNKHKLYSAPVADAE